MILFENLHEKNNQWTLIHVVHQLKNENIKIYIRHEWKIETLIKEKNWIQYFKRFAKIHCCTYEIIITLMRTKSFQLNYDNVIHNKWFKKRLYANNHYFAYYHSSKNIIYVEWIKKKLNLDKKFTSIVIKFIISKLTNEIMRNKLFYEKNSHLMK